MKEIKNENGDDSLIHHYKLKKDLLKDFDISKFKLKELTVEDPDGLDSRTYEQTFNKIVSEFSKVTAKELDRAVIESIIRKAALYDTHFNPYTVTAHEKHNMIRSFCEWLLTRIEEDSLAKEQIVELIQEYAKL
jgi:hypothetical protein